MEFSPVRFAAHRLTPTWNEAVLVLCCILLSAFHTGRVNAQSTDALVPELQDSTPTTSCLIPSAGAPSCEADTSPGSSPGSTTIPYHVGNPIDVISGNKYQQETDYRSFDTGLALVRHYNSSLADYDIGFGPGWRHTYQVFLTKSGETGLNITQSDGRLITFSHIPGTDSPRVYQAQVEQDGVLTFGTNSRWYLPDGRQFSFDGSYLTELDFGDRRGRLTLQYQNRRVHTVTDSRGGVLTFNYTKKHSSLPEYGGDGLYQPVGSIQSVTLPNGELINYQYGKDSNLVNASYADGDSVQYSYDNTDWPNHLTGRYATLEARKNTWQYDTNGLATAWSEGADGNSVQITRVQPEGSDYEQANVVYADGRQELFQWIPRANEADQSNHSVELTCDNCARNLLPTTETGASTSRSATSAIDNITHQIWQTLDRAARRHTRSGTDVFRSSVRNGNETIGISITVNRLGEVSNLEVGTTSLRELAPRLLRAELQPCSVNYSRQTLEELTFTRLKSMDSDTNPCAADVMVLLNLMDTLNSQSQRGLSETTNATSPQSRSRKGRVSEFINGTLRFCEMPNGKTCDELIHDLEMANLSKCAYDLSDCNTHYEVVDIAMLGIKPSRLSDKGFDAVFYREPGSDNYILAFRGTNGDGDDWENNFSQAKGLYARQYYLAQKLAVEIESELRKTGGNINFTGHSLGGGLATIAALATKGQADIFNASAVQPATADMFGYTDAYNQSELYVNHVHTDSDPLTFLQLVSDDIDYHPTSTDNNGNTIYHDEYQSVHGNNTEIPNPETTWVNAVFERVNPIDPVQGLIPVILHSIDAVIHTLENIVSRNCPSPNP